MRLRESCADQTSFFAMCSAEVKKWQREESAGEEEIFAR